MRGDSSPASMRRILVFNRYFIPGYRAGGPIRTLVNLIDRLGTEYDFRVVTLDRDYGDSNPYPNIPDDWTTVGNAKVRYLSPRKVSFRTLERIIREVSPDVLYLNSFFDPMFTQRVLWLRRSGCVSAVPIILAPRGEFSAGALGLKTLKKTVYLKASEWLGIYNGLTWQASSARERADILARLQRVQNDAIVEAMNLAPLDVEVPIEFSEREAGAPLKVCFLSRISPMKNLDFALRVLSKAKAEICFTIYGPKELPSYWTECERLIANLPSNVSVVYGDELHPSTVQPILVKHDLFLFPTRGENYGHVIHEALSAGLPVLISDQTPWGDVASRGVGWVLPLNDERAFACCIDDYAGWPPDKVAEIRSRARAYSLVRSDDHSALGANRRLFMDAIVRVGA